MANEMIGLALKALADPTRLHILEFLASNCCGEAAIQEDGGIEGSTAGEICCHITGAEKITSTVSHHLHELAKVGLIDINRRGKSMVCTLNPDAVRSLSQFFTDLLGAKSGPGCCC